MLTAVGLAILSVLLAMTIVLFVFISNPSQGRKGPMSSKFRVDWSKKKEKRKEMVIENGEISLGNIQTI